MRKAMLYGVCTSLISLIVWFSILVLFDWYFGFFPLIIGFAIGSSMYHGYGKKESTFLAIVAAIFTLLAVLIGHVLITTFWILDPATEGSVVRFFQFIIEQPLLLPTMLLTWLIMINRNYVALYFLCMLLSITKLQASKFPF